MHKKCSFQLFRLFMVKDVLVRFWTDFYPFGVLWGFVWALERDWYPHYNSGLYFYTFCWKKYTNILIYIRNILKAILSFDRLFLGSFWARITTYQCYTRPCMALQMVNWYADDNLRLHFGLFSNPGYFAYLLIYTNNRS
jgi:hypothetical protein